MPVFTRLPNEGGLANSISGNLVRSVGLDQNGGCILFLRGYPVGGEVMNRPSVRSTRSLPVTHQSERRRVVAERSYAGRSSRPGAGIQFLTGGEVRSMPTTANPWQAKL